MVVASADTREMRLTEVSTHFEVVAFFNREAELLDNGEFRDWQGLLTEDIVYQVPLRVTQKRHTGSGFVPNAWHMTENWGTIDVRINRLYTEYAWGEDPASRTRHFVSNVRVQPAENADELAVQSNLLLYRSAHDSPTPDVISGERHDLLRRVGGEWKLARRVVYLDQTVVSSYNLALFF